MRWTESQVIAMAPDPGAASAARGLMGGRWSETGATESLVWGKCQGSARTPYQVTVDLNGPAFRCTCPSRKFPCKHGLALLLLWVRGQGSVADAAAPADFAAEWAAERASRSEARASRTAGVPVADPAAQQRRLQARVERMDGALEAFAEWIEDIARAGLASARARPHGDWDAMAAQLVDGQVPGLAERVRELPALFASGSRWPQAVLAEVARWHLAEVAWQSRDALSPAQLGDLRAFLGWPHQRDELPEGAAGTWRVLGVRAELDRQLSVQRTWVRDEDSGEVAVVLDFAAAGQPLRPARLPGARVTCKAVRYPGSAPARVAFEEEAEAGASPKSLGAGLAIAGALRLAAEGYARNPLAERMPLLVEPARLVPAEGAGGLVLLDDDGDALPARTHVDAWHALALTGGAPLKAFAEWDGATAQLCSVAVGTEVFSL